MTPALAPVLLDKAQAQFITRRVSMYAASCDSRFIPSVSRAFGCRVSPDRRWVTIFLSLTYSRRLLEDLQGGAANAVLFSLPSTHETLQLKAANVTIQTLEEGDRELMRAYGKSFHDELSELGYHELFAGGIVSGVEEEAVAIGFTPIAAFEQTPGPDAGRALAPRP